MIVRVQGRDAELVPSAFSPNGDGINDRFGPYPDPAITRIEEFQVVDRWGNPMYTVSDCPVDATQSCAWDGLSLDGEPLDTGVFAYYMRLRIVDGTTLTRTGDVFLLNTRP